MLIGKNLLCIPFIITGCYKKTGQFFSATTGLSFLINDTTMARPSCTNHINFMRSLRVLNGKTSIAWWGDKIFVVLSKY